MATDDGMVGGVLNGRYKLTAHLRPGQFGDFWRGVRLTDGAPVAIKLLKPELFENPTAMARFSRETRLLASFSHPNLLRVLEYGRTSTGAPWVVTEPHDGRLLSDAVAELNLTIGDVCNIGAQIALVLAATHARGIIHRGLDPEAILLVRNAQGREVVKLQDFGLAHLARTRGPASTDPALTKVGERLGRYEYMAPEYIEEQVLDARTDLYVLGVILFEMLAGQPPFVGAPLMVLMKHVSDDPWAPSDLAEQDVPKWMDDLILSMLAKDARDRPQDAASVARALMERRWPVPGAPRPRGP
ncbi:MAG: serine/threonine-protein kinase [Myxococcota bacterium]